MKKLYVAAGALLIGSSALAWAAEPDAMTAKPVGESLAATALSGDDLIDKYSTNWNPGEAETVAASAVDKSLDGRLVAAKLEDGGYAEWSADTAQAKLAQAGVQTDPLAAGTLSASADKAGPTIAADAGTGMGGPVEDGMTTTADLTPRPAAGNYRPCEPGPGDDNCIQLYEPGVRAQLASWTAPTGGLGDSSTATAMGGPYEPVTGHSDARASSPIAGETAMNGDAVIDPAAGESQDLAKAASEPEIGVEHQGVGGPVVSQSGYPPCTPGAGDDRCIQLYERGVTGAGN